MSTTTPQTIGCPGAAPVITMLDELATDNPKTLYAALYPEKSEEEVETKVNQYYLRTLTPLVKNVHALPLEGLIRESGLSKSEVDILTKGLIEDEAMFDSDAQQLYDACIYKNVGFLKVDYTQLKDADLYHNMIISR